ncbi:MAG: AmmeMemoRadiSam system protein B [Candidatus Heimdallarchaeota archaeon]
MLRQPAVAGQFYPGTESSLIKSIESSFLNEKIGPGELPDREKSYERKGDIIGVIVPHAGYVYSGPIAAHGYLKQYQDGKPEFFIIIGPNHRNIGPPISVYSGGNWSTPLGEATIPEDIIAKIVKQPHFRADTAAHMMEHSIEVQVPFLQYLYGPNIPIVPICLKDQSFEACDRIGTVLKKVLKGHDFCLIASTDFSHYISQAEAFEQDHKVIEQITKLKPKNVIDTVNEEFISMCGPGAVASVLELSKNLGAKHVDVLKYATSGDVSGDKNHVVAYMSAIITK